MDVVAEARKAEHTWVSDCGERVMTVEEDGSFGCGILNKDADRAAEYTTWCAEHGIDVFREKGGTLLLSNIPDPLKALEWRMRWT
ncbi:MAG: hypothetical protein EOP83_14825 [Verrucomicrobiaceae bacterium]|nr:MAG: hypothetical protein EOP83_14825 [Verrucomicrobiaceae bacterium]